MFTNLPRRLGLFVLLGLAGLLGCAHGIGAKSAQLSPTSQALASEAGAVASVTSEEDFFEAKLLYQALPENAVERSRLRGKLLDYLLAPIAALNAEQLRRSPALLGTEDDFDRLQDSFRDALDLFPPSSLWAGGGPQLSDRERQLLQDAAKLLLAAYSPRGNELPVATALFVLGSTDGANHEWPARLDQLFSWLESGTQVGGGQLGPHRQASPSEVLESIAAVWPAPEVLDRLAHLVFARQDKVARILRRPVGSGEGARGLLSELLLDTESLSAMSVSAAAIYLRCGQLAKANQVAAHFADKPRLRPRRLTIWRWPGGSSRATRSFAEPPPIASIRRPPWAFCTRGFQPFHTTPTSCSWHRAWPGCSRSPCCHCATSTRPPPPRPRTNPTPTCLRISQPSAWSWHSYA